MNNQNNLISSESFKTSKFTNCINSRNHDIGCECLTCKSCREDIIDFYKKKNKNYNKKRPVSRSFDDTMIRSNPIPINNKENNKKLSSSSYMTFNSLPNMYNKNYAYSNNNIIDDKCLILIKIIIIN